MEETHNQDTRRAKLEDAINTASRVVAAYGAVLEQLGQPGIPLHPESELPFSKVKIRHAIELLLLMPCDETQRNNLEVVDVCLNDFVPDMDYHIVEQQRSGLAQALKNFKDGNLDATQLVKTMSDGVTEEGEAQLRLIEERVKHDNLRTLERHNELRSEADQLRKR